MAAIVEHSGLFLDFITIRLSDMRPEEQPKESIVQDIEVTDYSFVQQEFVNWFEFVFQGEGHFLGTLILLGMLSGIFYSFLIPLIKVLCDFCVSMIHGHPTSKCHCKTKYGESEGD